MFQHRNGELGVEAGVWVTGSSLTQPTSKRTRGTPRTAVRAWPNPSRLDSRASDAPTSARWRVLHVPNRCLIPGGRVASIAIDTRGRTYNIQTDIRGCQGDYVGAHGMHAHGTLVEI
jgi:hypothetical protein